MWLAARSQKKHDWLGAGGALPIVKMSDGLPAIPAAPAIPLLQAWICDRASTPFDDVA